jgi:hypothetical protein
MCILTAALVSLSCVSAQSLIGQYSFELKIVFWKLRNFGVLKLGKAVIENFKAVHNYLDVRFVARQSLWPDPM